jgi:hypothetical protein
VLAHHVLSILLAGYAGDAVPGVSVITTQLLFAVPSRAAVRRRRRELNKLTLSTALEND